MMPLPVVPLILGAFAVAGGGALVVAARRAPVPGWPPLPSQARPELSRYSAALSVASKLAGKALPPFQFVAVPPPAKPLPTFGNPPIGKTDAAWRFSLLKAARPDADPSYRDGYSRHTYQVVSRPNTGAWLYSASGWPAGVDPVKSYGVALDPTGKAGSPIDEFGRYVGGLSGNPLGTMLQAAGFVAPFIPGVGPAASAALAAAVALGEGKSLKDAALAGARAAIPGGALGQMAFDLGVGVASGKPVDAAAEQAFLAHVSKESPEALAAYQAGKALA